jgi:hypothetical protein
VDPAVQTLVTDAIKGVFGIGVLVCLLALGAVWLIPEVPLRASSDPPTAPSA